MADTKDHDTIARRILEGAGFVELDDVEEKVPGATADFNMKEVVKFLLGDRADDGNLFFCPSPFGDGARIVCVKTNANDDRYILLHESKDDPESLGIHLCSIRGVQRDKNKQGVEFSNWTSKVRLLKERIVTVWYDAGADVHGVPNRRVIIENEGGNFVCVDDTGQLEVWNEPFEKFEEEEV